MLRRILAIFKARNLEFLRDRATLAWNIVLPLALMAGLEDGEDATQHDRFLLLGPQGMAGKIEKQVFEIGLTDLDPVERDALGVQFLEAQGDVA